MDLQREKLEKYFSDINKKVAINEEKQRKKNVLYLEDSSEDAYIFRRLMKSGDAEITTFLTVKDLNRFLDENDHKKWDLVVIDYNSAFFWDIEKTKELVKCENVLITSSANRFECKDLGDHAFTEKRALTQTVTELLRF